MRADLAEALHACIRAGQRRTTSKLFAWLCRKRAISVSLGVCNHMLTFALVTLGAIPVEFLLFDFTLVGVALFYQHTLQVALAGLAGIKSYKLAFTPAMPAVL